MRPRTAIIGSAIYATLMAVVVGTASVRRGFGWELASLGLVLGYSLLLLEAGVYAVGRWAELRWRALVPALLLLAGLSAAGGVPDAGRALRDAGLRLDALEAETVVRDRRSDAGE
ncbi:MAG: hypothetical protein ACREMX_02790 [Gemmatimonadales bacterium]